MAVSLEDLDCEFDLNTAIPETELLDNSIHKGKAQLPVKTRRSRLSRSNHHDSTSSTEGDDRYDRKESPRQCAHSPLHLVPGSSPFSESSQSPAFSFESSSRGRAPENRGTPLAAPQKGRYHQLINATSQEALVSPSSSQKSSLSSDGSPVHLRRSKWPEADVLVSDGGCDCGVGDSGGPTVVFDKKTKRRFLDLGVTLRRSYIRVRKDKSNRLSVASREPSESPSRSSGSLVSFSWFTEGRGSFSSSGTPPSSPRTALLSFNKPRRSQSQESALSEEFSAPHTSSSISPSTVDSHKSSHQYQTLSPSSDEPRDEASSSVSSWTPQEVCQWLKGLNMEQYITEFMAKDIDGEQLLQMNGSRLKGLGVLSSSDRSMLKQHIKDLQAADMKERKALDKQEKKKEKQRKKHQEQRRN
ncbi:sterile alpha motif domain-containing protein 14 isoform X1 [Oryzias melastigma]|uniref:Sterile alpha motif domain-containing protein 14-like n=1 Tax=Oryzias melastigma TaxID=30732 RepID=A0A3B3BD71_ORYME|nr:sterile alpha motif domain-containing protein 14 isoform X1 [Oryzias melastigma]XP_024140178.1 sterile alpha motif domain-containing protein 14 isoform X1 [Oryzias melastigma]XP_024140179.1 sterile alpha motif domain-containing protein 14 isoform X1 [Oryzias melastigma]XP_024140180.1 sterile alpha motif domain-containing protein 14 isoform X1 [Oryzias melastigma]XP_024140181.1 sterile alpha motif domain-containing protein 14 isoform X1 [Oryzias melastigma]